MHLNGKHAVITGGTSGIGKAIAKTFKDAGATVTILARTAKRGEAAAEELGVTFLQADVGKEASVKEAFGRLPAPADIVVNCAGITKDTLMMRMKEEDWDDVLDINLKSVFLTTKEVMRSMMKNRYGRIINISSVIGLKGNAGQVNYAASKAGMIGMTRSLAKEVATRGITVNCIAPGFFDTEMTGKLTEEQKEKIAASIPMQRFGKLEELAHTALFLASDQAGYITGQTITVDGGMIA